MVTAYLRATVIATAFAVASLAYTPNADAASCYNCCKAKMTNYDGAKRGSEVYWGPGDYGSQWRCPYYEILVKNGYDWEKVGTCYVQSRCTKQKKQSTY